MTAGTMRVPVDTSVMIMLEDEEGVNPDNVIVDVNGQVVASTVHEALSAGDLRQVWVVYDSLGAFDYDEVVSVTVEACDIYGHWMTPYAFSFKTETLEEHQLAANTAPETTVIVNAAPGMTAIVGQEGGGAGPPGLTSGRRGGAHHGGLPRGGGGRVRRAGSWSGQHAPKVGHPRRRAQRSFPGHARVHRR